MFSKIEIINRLEVIDNAPDGEVAGDLILDLYIDFVEALAKDDYSGSPNEMARLISKGLHNEECKPDSNT
jgi:hypothetical protein